MCKRRRKLSASSLVAVATEELQTQACSSETISSKPWKKCRVRKKARNRLKWREFCDNEEDGRFKRYFRVTKERFRFLAEHEELACLQPKRSDGIQLEVQLALTLRFLAGGSYLDLEKIFGVDGDTTLYTIVGR